MLLRRLVEYADQCGLPPPLYQEKNIRYLILLKEDGEYLKILDCATEQRKRGNSLAVPNYKRANEVFPYLLADNASYVLGFRRKENDKQERVHQCHTAFIEQVRVCAQETQEPTVQAVLRFYEAYTGTLPDLPKDFDPTAWITFEVGEERPVTLKSVQHHWADTAVAGDADHLMQCLVCGNRRPSVKLLPVSIHGIPGGLPGGVGLVVADKPSFWSYGLEKSLVGATCEACGERFSNALNHLLREEETRIYVSSLVYIFWSREPSPFSLTTLLSDAAPEDVKELFHAPWKGRKEAVQGDAHPFYAAVLSATGGRAVVRDWMETTLDTIHDNLKRYFAFQRSVNWNGEDHWFRLSQLVSATVNQKAKNVQKEPVSEVAEALLHFAFYGGTLPLSVLYRVLRRTRAERDVQSHQAALIKMVLLSQRSQSSLGRSNEEGGISERKVHDMAEVDPENTDRAYLCGRLLAHLEEIQLKALGDINTGIIDRYYGAASSAPATIFARLLHLAQMHLAKLRGDKSKQGMVYRLDTQLQELLESFAQPGQRFPSTLTLMQQGDFAIGYHNQKLYERRAAQQGAAKKAEKKQEGTQAPADGGTTAEVVRPSHLQEEIINMRVE